ncbi:Intradiol ring-cleavage dioxygenase [Usnea florida]
MHDILNCDHTLIYVTVTDYLTDEPIERAELDVWHTAPNGLYKQQDENQIGINTRGRFTRGKDDHYHFYCLRPTSKPIPNDDDVTFAVKDSLVVDFLLRENDLQADSKLQYNFRLANFEQAKKFSLAGTLEEIAGIGANGRQRVIVS